MSWETKDNNRLMLAKNIDLTKLCFSPSRNCRPEWGYSVDIQIPSGFTEDEAKELIKQLKSIIREWWTKQ